MFYKNGKVLLAGIVLLFLAASTLTVVANVQPPETEWEKTFGGSDPDCGRSVQQTSDGGYIITGYYDFHGYEVVSRGDVYLVKTDADGNLEWEKTFGGSKVDLGASVQQTSDGGYIIVGGTHSYGAGWEDVYLIKTDTKGNKIWEKTYGGGSWDKGNSIQRTTDGGYIIGGDTASFGVGGWYDYWLIKTDSKGDKQWDKTFGGSAREHCLSVQQTSDGGYIMTGFTDSYGAGKGDYYLVKTDADGNLEWEKTFGGSEDDVAMSVQQTSDGGYIMTGRTDSYGAGGRDAWLVKTDADGNLEWEKTFGGSEDDVAMSVQQTSDGGYIITGFVESYGAAARDAWLVKTDAFGYLEWQKTVGGSEDDQGYFVQLTSDGGYIMTGFTDSYGAGGSDVYLIKETPPPKKLSVKLTGEFDYLKREPVKIRVAALVTDADTMEPVSGANVTIQIYDPKGNLKNFRGKTSLVMVEKIGGSGIYEWTSSKTIEQFGLFFRKGVYLVGAQASYKDATGYDILLFHIDPPAEGTSEALLQIALTAVASVGVTALILKRRRIIQRIRQLN